jgi:serine/threonine protein kinase
MTMYAGSRFGPFRLVAEIGRGGMSVVYKAYDPRAGRYLALKVLPAYFQHDRQFLERFQREAEAISALRHPNVVRIYETGQAGRCHFLAMEYAEGGSLADLLARQQGPLPLIRVLDIARQVAAALQHAHDRGLVHRDLKPSNILLAGDGRVLLSDFGIAKILGRITLTGPGTIMGTPAYMAPEQARGQTDLDHRADIYALGIILYEMLAGRVPFDGDTPLSVLRAVIDDPPRRPTALNPAIPIPVEAVVLRALSKDRARRFQQAKEMAAALQAAHHSSPPCGVSRAAEPESGSGTAYRHGHVPAWLFVTAGILVAIALILALIVAFSQPNPPTPTATAVARVLDATIPAAAPSPMGSGEDATINTAVPTAQEPGGPATDQPSLPPAPTQTLATTPVPTATGTLKPTEPLPSKTPRPVPSATLRLTSTPRPAYSVPILLQPDDQARIADRDTVELRWEWDGTLKEDDYFDVRVWREEQDHLGVAWTKETYYSLHIPSLEQRLSEPDRAGTYYWAVAVLRGAGGKVIKDLSPESTERRFEWVSSPSPEKTREPRPTEDTCAACSCDEMCARGACAPCCHQCCGGCK